MGGESGEQNPLAGPWPVAGMLACTGGLVRAVGAVPHMLLWYRAAQLAHTGWAEHAFAACMLQRDAPPALLELGYVWEPAQSC
jgi:hypothetical protein